MMTHTKGPWRAERQKSFSYSIHTDYAHDRGHDCNIVREVRCEANAFLIAAAPELLESLKEFVALANFDANTLPKTNEEWDAMVAKAEAVIRKAQEGSNR